MYKLVSTKLTVQYTGVELLADQGEGICRKDQSLKQGLALLLLSTAKSISGLSTAKSIWTGKRGRGRKSSPAVHADLARHNGNTGDWVGCRGGFCHWLL